MSVPKCQTCGRKHTKKPIACPQNTAEHACRAGCLVAHLRIRPDCSCGPPAETVSAKPAATSQQKQRERADTIATMIAGGLPNCPPIRELTGAIQLALEATEPEVNTVQTTLAGTLTVEDFTAMVDTTARMAASHKRLMTACEGTLLFHRGGHWTSDDTLAWKKLTALTSLTTKSLCDFIRAAINQAPAAAEGGAG